jgi:hypothetical protein
MTLTKREPARDRGDLVIGDPARQQGQQRDVGECGRLGGVTGTQKLHDPGYPMDQAHLPPH